MPFTKRKIIDIAALTAYIGFIYATLPVVPKIFLYFSRLIGWRRLRAIADIILLLIPLFLVSLLRRKIRHRSFKTYIALLAIVFIYAISVRYFTPIVAEKFHFIEYSLLSYLALRVFKDMRSRDLKYLNVIATLVVVGYLDELIQKFLPSRVYQLSDVYLNIFGGLLGLVFIRLSGCED